MQSSVVYRSRPFYTSAQIEYLIAGTEMAGSRGLLRLQTIARHTLEVCSMLGFPKRTVYTAMVLVQQMLLANTPRERTVSLVAGCIFLASKIEDTSKRPREIVEAALRVMYPRAAAPSRRQVEDIKAALHRLELLLLETVCFDFRTAQAHTYVVKIAKELDIDKQMCRVAWEIASDSLSTWLPVMQPAHVVALACLAIAAKVQGSSIFPLKSGALSVARHTLNVALDMILGFYTINYSESYLAALNIPNAQDAISKFLIAVQRDSERNKEPEPPLDSLAWRKKPRDKKADTAEYMAI